MVTHFKQIRDNIGKGFGQIKYPPDVFTYTSLVDSYVLNYFNSKSYVKSASKIDAYNSPISQYAYRIAFRVKPNTDFFHFVYQLSNGTWAGKNGIGDSINFGNVNPSTVPNTSLMWELDLYPPSAGTSYFAVEFY